MAEEAKGGDFFDGIIEWLAEKIEHFIHPDDTHHKPDFIHQMVSKVGGWGISRGLFLCVIFIALNATAAGLFPVYPRLVVGWLILGLPVIGPVGLIAGFYKAWLWYVQSLYIFQRTKPMLLEVRMPADVFKSPRAMEQVITGFWIRSGVTTFIDRLWNGGVLPYFAFELVSIGGQVHFFIWTRGMYKNALEATFYAQYPEVEILEVEDYASHFVYSPDAYDNHAAEFAYTKSDAYPIKTYVDFELDRDPKEELKVEPFAQVLETLSMIGKDEQAWVQIVLRGAFGGVQTLWEDRVKEEVNKIRKEMTLSGENGDAGAKFPRPAWRQQEQLKVMERNLAKLPFEVGMRLLYWAPRGKSQSPHISAIRNLWRPFDNQAYQNRISATRGHSVFDFPWQDWNGVRSRLTTRRYLDAYRRRMFFHTPWITPTQVVTTEVLATLFHPPSRTVRSPGLQRIATSKAEPPVNLPT